MLTIIDYGRDDIIDAVARLRQAHNRRPQEARTPYVGAPIAIRGTILTQKTYRHSSSRTNNLRKKRKCPEGKDVNAQFSKQQGAARSSS
jgi:hypothetical protein